MNNEAKGDELAIQSISTGRDVLFDGATVIYSSNVMENSISGNRFYRIADQNSANIKIYDSNSASASIINDRSIANIPDSAYSQQVISTQTNYSTVQLKPTGEIKFSGVTMGSFAELPQRQSVISQPQISLTRSEVEIKPTDTQLTQTEYNRIDLEAMYPSSIEAERLEHLEKNPPPPLHSHEGYIPAQSESRAEPPAHAVMEEITPSAAKPSQSAEKPISYSKSVQGYINSREAVNNSLQQQVISTNQPSADKADTPLDRTGSWMVTVSLFIAIFSIITCFSGISFVFGTIGIIFILSAMKKTAKQYKIPLIVALVLSITGCLAGIFSAIVFS